MSLRMSVSDGFCSSLSGSLWRPTLVMQTGEVRGSGPEEARSRMILVRHTEQQFIPQNRIFLLSGGLLNTQNNKDDDISQSGP